MLLYFLGTGAGKPSTYRNVTSILLQLPSPYNTLWLFDCGEGTQQQLLRSPYTFTKISHIFISHLHGDHLFGLPGLLSTRSFYAKANEELTVYGPPGIQQFLNNALNISGTHLTYPLQVHELDGETMLSIDGLTVKAHLLEHVVMSYGFRVEEPNRPGKLDADKLRAMQVPPGPVYGRLKQGETVVLDDGRVLRSEDFVGPEQPGRKFVFCGDTRYCTAAIELAANADVLVHEATFAGAQTDKAFAYYHSTTTQAAAVAKAANVRQLVLTHISSRFRPEDCEELLKEAQEIFPNTLIAMDHFSLPIDYR